MFSKHSPIPKLPICGCELLVHAIASVMPNSVPTYQQQPARLLCPWDSPGKNAAVGCIALMQGILLTRGLDFCLFCLLPWQKWSLPLAPPGV